MTDLTTDRLDLRYLAEAYARGCDTKDAAVLASCFTDGATLTIHWVDREPSTLRMPGHVDRILKGLDRYQRTIHFVGNHTAQVDGDSATGVTYCFAHHILDGNDHLMAIRYEDVYRREPDGWRIAERHLRLDWTQDLPVSGTR